MLINAISGNRIGVRHSKSEIKASLEKQSFGFLVNQRQAHLLEYLRQTAPKHSDFYGEQIVKNAKNTEKASIIRDLYMSLAIAEARVLLIFNKFKNIFKTPQ